MKEIFVSYSYSKEPGHLGQGSGIMRVPFDEIDWGNWRKFIEIVGEEVPGCTIIIQNFIFLPLKAHDE